MSGEGFADICAKNGLPLTADALAGLERYVALLKEKNEVLNLISRKDEDNILEKHVLHSLTLAMPDVCGSVIPRHASLFDLGTGGGLPGIPLAIVRADITVVLCDSIAKKITAVAEIAQALSLTNVRTVTARAEMLEKDASHAKKYDLVVSRAVAPLDDLVKWSYGLIKKGGALLALKGGDITEELQRTRKLKYVSEADESLLALAGYDLFARDEKKVARVRFGS